jgi:hypothetical protein
VFFLEAVSWELFIYLGLIPVNTQYRAVFDRSTAGMQIVSEDGRPIVRSASAPVLTEAQFSALRQNRHASAGAGQELQIYRIQNGYFIWQRDVSQLNSVIAQLRRSAAALEQESVLLSQELKIKSEEAAVAEQNRIYDRLSVEVGPQLHLLRQLLAKRDAVPDRAALFREICLVGTYVKRRCSLRLIEQTDGAISGDDLALSFREITGRLGDMGIDAQLFWSAAPLSSAAFALLCLDTFRISARVRAVFPAPDGGALAAGFLALHLPLPRRARRGSSAGGAGAERRARFCGHLRKFARRVRRAAAGGRRRPMLKRVYRIPQGIREAMDSLSRRDCAFRCRTGGPSW